MSDTNTARERIREITFSLATGARVVLPTEVPEALDAYRDEVLAEAAELLLAEVPSRRYCAHKLLAARSAGQATTERPVVVCELPHPVAPDTWCALRIEHDGWHEDGAGDRWPNALLAVRTTTEER